MAVNPRRPEDPDKTAASETDSRIGIPIGEIRRWVESWDTPAELPMPKARKIE